MRITILGCSGGIAAGLRTTCLMLDDDILIDAGTGAGDLTRSELSHIESVFLTHSHLDHIALLPMLLNTTGVRRSKPLIVYALPETIEILEQHIFNFKIWPDYTVLPTPFEPYLKFCPVRIGETIESSGRRVTPHPVDHSVPGVAYQLDSGKSSFVFSGDTGYHELFWNAVSHIDNLSYLMIEATFFNRNIDDANNAKHMRPELLARGLKHLRKPVQLLITHMEPGNEEIIMEEIRSATDAFVAEKLERGQIFEL